VLDEYKFVLVEAIRT